MIGITGYTEALRAEMNTVSLSAYLHALRSGHPTPTSGGT